jgi:hypothetical protein
LLVGGLRIEHHPESDAGMVNEFDYDVADVRTMSNWAENGE